MIIKMIMCKQVGMQENEHIKDLSKKYSLQEEDFCINLSCPFARNGMLTSLGEFLISQQHGAVYQNRHKKLVLQNLCSVKLKSDAENAYKCKCGMWLQVVSIESRKFVVSRSVA